MPLRQRALNSRLRKLLEERNWDKIVSLAEKEMRIVNELIELLEDSAPEVRGSAAGALEIIAREDAEAVKVAVPRLTEVLQDSAPEV